MHENHRQTIANLGRTFEADPNALALIIIGSVARDEAGPTSDVDFYVVVDEDEYHRCKSEHDLFFNLNDVAVAPTEGANGRAISIQTLKDAVDHGSEPFRYSLRNAIVPFSRLQDIESLLQNCTVYPEPERHEKMVSFAAQIPVHFSFLEFGQYSQNAYVLAETGVKIVLFGGRLLLAYNRMLYPGRKGFMRELAKASNKPPNIIELANQLLTKPSIETAQAFIDPVMSYADWPQPLEGNGARYFRDSIDLWEDGWFPIDEY